MMPWLYDDPPLGMSREEWNRLNDPQFGVLGNAASAQKNCDWTKAPPEQLQRQMEAMRALSPDEIAAWERSQLDGLRNVNPWSHEPVPPTPTKRPWPGFIAWLFGR